MKFLPGVKNNLVDWLNQQIRPATSVPLSDYQQLRHELKPGDVLLVEGRTRASAIISSVTNSPWTHSALYVGRIHDLEDESARAKIAQHYHGDPGDQLVIESILGKGIIVTNLLAYQDEHLRICRPRGVSFEDTQKVMHFAVMHLGQDYDLRQGLDLLRFLLPWPLFPRRWRTSLFKARTGMAARQICCSLIAAAFSSVRYPILPLIRRDEAGGIQFVQRSASLYTPSDFDYSPYFDIVKYPYISEKPHYHSIPWREDGYLSDNKGNLFMPEHEKK